MEFVRVADKAELPPNKMIIVVVGGKEVLLANVDGSYFAIANKCTHAGGSLAKVPWTEALSRARDMVLNLT